MKVAEGGARHGRARRVGAVNAGSPWGGVTGGRAALGALLTAVLAACATAPPVEDAGPPYHQRAEAKVSEGLLVEAAALGASESRRMFGAALNLFDVQPVWIRIENRSGAPQWLFPVGVDPDYFPPYEVARRVSGLSAAAETELFRRLQRMHIRSYIPDGEVAVGFIYAHADEGMKALDVRLHGPGRATRFHFVAPVPGLPLSPFALQGRNTVVDASDLSLPELRDWLEELPCCTVSEAGRAGDPLNIVLVGSLEAVRGALISRGWDVAVPITSESVQRMVSAFVFGSRYRYAPVSPLRVFGRPQDLAFQRARNVLDERNHMRLWLAPVTHGGAPVWVGQVSRDVGVKLTGKLWPPVTHVIDPDVDDARFFVLQDLTEGGWVRRLGYAAGQPPSDASRPGRNAEGDPYFTDGLRAVFFVSEEPAAPGRLEFLDWRLPPALEPHRRLYTGPR